MTCNVLLLHSDSARIIGTVAAHLDAFQKYSAHRIVEIDSVSALSLGIDLSYFDCLVFHYSIVIASRQYIPDQLRARIAAFRGPKVLFIQDEMRWVDATSAAIRELGIGTVFTVVNKEAVRPIYRAPWLKDVRFELTLTGFVPEELISVKVPPYQDRALDVVYRARKLPGWCGSFAQEKWIIGNRFANDAVEYGLLCDISSREGDRIYGGKWIEFIANSKATLGVESGASFIDYTGEVAPAIEAFEAANPNVPFDQIRDRFLQGRDGEVSIRVISPRCFEAAALRTLMIMYEGEYSGILRANRHYVPLARDHSNMKEVVEIIRDPGRALPIIQNAYEEIACSGAWTFRTFISHFDKVITEECSKANYRAVTHLSPADVQVLHAKSRRIASWRRRRTRAAIAVQRLETVTYHVLDRHLPASIGRPLLKMVRRGNRILKPMLKKLLLGQSE